MVFNGAPSGTPTPKRGSNTPTRAPSLTNEIFKKVSSAPGNKGGSTVFHHVLFFLSLYITLCMSAVNIKAVTQNYFISNNSAA